MDQRRHQQKKLLPQAMARIGDAWHADVQMLDLEVAVASANDDAVAGADLVADLAALPDIPSTDHIAHTSGWKERTYLLLAPPSNSQHNGPMFLIQLEYLIIGLGITASFFRAVTEYIDRGSSVKRSSNQRKVD